MALPAPRAVARATTAALAACLALAALPFLLAQNPWQPPYTIRTQVPLTIVDVTVTDADGHPVRGLKQSDFTLLEDGKQMALNSFEEHRSDTTAASAPVAPPLTLPPNTFTNATPAAAAPNRPINILLIDSMDTPTAFQVIVRNRMLDFIGKMPAGTRVAVFALSAFGRLSILQGFTTDRELLKAAVNSSKLMATPPPMEDDQTDPANSLEGAAGEGERMAERAEYSLAAMRQLARYLAGIPGRKNLLWVGGSYPPNWPPQDPPDPTLGMDPAYDVTDEMKAAADLLARAHVAISPIESRGVGSVSGPHIRRKMLDEHYSMDTVADLTGGHAYYNTNGLDLAAADAIELGSNFYTLTYAPTNQNLDTRFRTIKVTVDKPGLHLTYRNGYYAVPPEVDARGKKIETVTPMQAALMRGALPATQIFFTVRIAPTAGTQSTLPADNTPDPKLLHPPYRRFTISYTIDVHGIQLTPAPDGNYRGDFEYGVRVYNADGDEIVNSAVKTVAPILPPAVYHSMLRGGANAHLDVAVPATGDYFLRIAVHDLATGHVGSLEVPTSSIHADEQPSAAPATPTK